MSKITHINAPEFESEVLSSKTPVLVDFWASWCVPCIQMEPVLDELAERHAKDLKIVKMNVEKPENVALAREHQIRSIPNMKVFKGGKIIGEVVGFHTLLQMEEELSNII